MAVEVFMPKAGMDMKEGTIIKWLVQTGQTVSEGDALLEIETDKVTMEVEAPADGVLLCQYFGDGTVVPVVTVIGYIGKEGEEVPETPGIAGGDDKAAAQIASGEVPAEADVREQEVNMVKQSTGTGVASPYAKRLAQECGIDLQDVVPTGVYGEIKARDIQAHLENAKSRPAATPLAARMAADMGIDIAAVSGSKHGGKVCSTDILTAGNTVKPEETSGERREKLSGMRRVVAQRMSQAHEEIPSATITTKVDVTELMKLRVQLKEQCGKKFSVNDMILKAVSMALSEHKEMLCSFCGDSIVYKEDVNIGMAVSVNNGLVVPVIKHADKLTLEEISAKARDLAVRARDNKLNMDEYKGSTFSISNLGMFGVESFTPIINQPDSAILGVCGMNTELALEQGQVVERKVMRLCITLDHRLMDGVQAATFNLAVKEYLENPMRLVL